MMFSGISKTSSQVLNADKFERNVDSLNTFTGMISLGVNMDNRSDFLIGVTGRAEFSVFFKKSVLIFASSYKFLRRGEQSLLQGGFSHLRLRFLVDKWYSPEIFGQAQLDQIRGLDRRFLAGANLRFRIFDNDSGSIYAGLGAMFERENWTDQGFSEGEPTPYSHLCNLAPCTTDLVKLNTYVAFNRNFSKTVNLGMVIYIQAVPDVTIKYPRVAGDLNLNFRITRNLKFAVHYSGFFDNGPAVPVNKYYFTMNNLLTLEW